jgi:hypothetical protein
VIYHYQKRQAAQIGECNMRKEKENRFIKCNTKIEAIAKSSFKGFKTDVLYCIVDEEIYVYQGLKLIRVSLEQFATGMDMDLIKAQAVAYGEGEIADEEIADEEIAAMQEEIDEFGTEGKDLGDAVFGGMDKQLEEVSDEFKEEAEDKLKDVAVGLTKDILKETELPTPAEEILSLKDRLLIIEKKLGIAEELEIEEEEESEEEVIADDSEEHKE